MGNSVVFPAPEETRIPNRMKSCLYFYNKTRDEEVSSLPTNTPLFCCGDRKAPQKIPFVYLKEETDQSRSQYLIIYFHGNSEVLSSTFKTLERLHKSLKLSVISAEYPGYGLYDTDSTSEENILENADAIIRYAINTLQYSESNIILVGKSFGTGVAARMGISYPNVKAIAMFSSYLSIREVVTNMVGSTLAKFVPNIFKTQEIVPYLKPPVLFVHGLKDPIVPCTNSSTLYYACNTSKMLIFSTTMDHRKADFRNDMYIPILKFFVEKLEMEEFTEQGNREKIRKLSALSNMKCIKPKHSPSRTSGSFSDLETLSTEGSKK